MALTETRPSTEALTSPVDPDSGAGSVERLIGTGDHLSVGRTYVVAALFFGAISALGLTLAGIDAASKNKFLGTSAALVWNSSVVGIIVAGVLPLLLGLAIYLVPLQVGSPAISFPRTAALSLWSWIIGVLIFAVSVVTSGGIGGTETDSARLGNLALGMMLLALCGAAVSVVTTVVSHRPLGMSLARVPLFSWSMLIAAPVWILTLGAALAGVIVSQASNTNAPGIFANYQLMIDGLWKAPAVYMLAIPVLGLAGDVTAKVAARRINAYGAAQGLIAAYGVFSFGVWAASTRAVASSAWKHVPVPQETVLFAGWVLVPGLFVLALLGLYSDTIRRSKLRISAAGVAGPLALLLVLGGVAAAALQVLDSIGKGALFGFETGQLGNAQMIFLVSAAACGAIGGTAFWGEKLWGHSSDALARGSVGLLFVGGGLLGTVFIANAVLAATDSPMGAALFGALLAVTAGIFTVGLVVALVSAISAASVGHADPLADDPDGLTLEWAVASPPSPVRIQSSFGTVASPYPLLDRREGDQVDTPAKEAN